MNSLSWFLYFADVLSNIQETLFISALVMALITLIVCIYTGGWPHIASRLTIVICMVVFLGAILPGKNTMYAIAASEMGQKAFESRVGNKALQAVEKWIDLQLQGK